MTTLITLNERVPLAAPNDFDDMPTSTAEYPLELLNDLAITTNRPIESLQVAVNDEVQVAETLTPRQRNRTERFGLITLAVTEETPDLAIAVINQASLALIFHDVRLVNGLDRP